MRYACGADRQNPVSGLAFCLRVCQPIRLTIGLCQKMDQVYLPEGPAQHALSRTQITCGIDSNWPKPRCATIASYTPVLMTNHLHLLVTPANYRYNELNRVGAQMLHVPVASHTCNTHRTPPPGWLPQAAYSRVLISIGCPGRKVELPSAVMAAFAPPGVRCRLRRGAPKGA